MSGRKHISWKTKCAAAVLDAMAQRERFGLYPRRWYDDAKKMTEDQFLSLFHWDHNILHSSENEDRDRFWNLTPIPILEHRAKTKADAKIIAKGRRIREKHRPPKEHAATTLAQLEKQLKTASYVRKLASRGFDKRYRKKLDGTVVKRND